jgi:hypothetical protein
MFRVELSFSDSFDQGARVTRVTMPTARYLALGKLFIYAISKLITSS